MNRSAMCILYSKRQGAIVAWYQHARSISVSKNCEAKKAGSKQWVNRQTNDPYVEQAKRDGWRCRSAYKLIQMQENYKIMQPGDVVIDCGASPGSWSQVAVQAVNSNGEDPDLPAGFVIGIDLQDIGELHGATFLENCDMNDNKTHENILQILHGRKADVVLSDMAPNTTGVKHLNQELIVNLCLSTLRLSTTVLRTNGKVLCKIWNGHEKMKVESVMEKLFKNVRILKPKASRKESAEIYLYGSGFVGTRV